MHGLTMSDEDWEKSEAESEKAFEMTTTGLFLIVISLIIEGICRLFDVHKRKHEQLLEHEVELTKQGEAEAARLLKQVNGNPDEQEEIISVYRKHCKEQGDSWLHGFFRGLPTPVKQNILIDDGKIEAIRLLEGVEDQPNGQELVLSVYQQHCKKHSDPWLGGFFSTLPASIREYIEERYKEHPEWVYTSPRGGALVRGK